MPEETDRTLRERVAYLEAKHDRLDQVIKDYEGMESFHLSLIEEMKKINENVEQLTVKTDKIYPVFKQVIQAKFYGSWTFKLFIWIGGTTIAILSQWTRIKHFIHYIFS